MSLTRLKIAVVILTLAVFGAACDAPGPRLTDAQTVALGGADRAEVVLNMGAGEMVLRGADQVPLLEASFEFNRERNRPEVDYRLMGGKGRLEIRHARRRGINFGPTRNRWDLLLSRAVPLEFDINLGAGKSDLDFRGFKIGRLEIDMGVGEMNLDLRGPHARSFDVKIDGGVGSGRLELPSEVGVRVKVDGGLGSIDARGLTKVSGAYVNEAYGKSPVTIDVAIDAGIGSLDLRCEPSGKI
jgi:N-terminal domain of toast_rack, DUF2154